MPTYYDGTKLLSLNDLNGNKPEIYMCTTNRTGGKTVWWNSFVFRKYITKGEKFCLFYRFNNELNSVAEKFFKDINGLFFPEYMVKAERRDYGSYMELYCYNIREGEEAVGRSCGYAISLNNADAVKRNSHMFSDVQRCVFDEFQSESNKYCTDEIEKFISVHISIARGQGNQARYVPVYMISNPVSLINPYYTAMGISTRLKSDTKFLRGDGWVLEQGFVESAARAQESSAFNRAFANHEYINYASQAVYLNDSSAFIEKPKGNSRYIGTIKYLGKEYGLREFADLGIIYCDDRPDTKFKYKLAVTTDDHDINYVMLKKNEMFVWNMRFFFQKGAFRFKDLLCKDAILKMISF